MSQSPYIAEIRRELLDMADPGYRAFHCRLIPTVDPARVIGVRTPALRRYAGQLAGTPKAAALLAVLPHHYYEENNLHGFLLERMQQPEELLAALDAFLPYVDNWATCDMISPPALAGRPDALLPAVQRWLAAGHPYTVRYGINVLMRHYLGEAFAPEYPAMVAAACTGCCAEEYYVHMGAAWYFATALDSRYDAVLPWLTGHRLPVWVHNKAIQKAIESRRISPQRKAYLRTLRR